MSQELRSCGAGRGRRPAGVPHARPLRLRAVDGFQCARRGWLYRSRAARQGRPQAAASEERNANVEESKMDGLLGATVLIRSALEDAQQHLDEDTPTTSSPCRQDRHAAGQTCDGNAPPPKNSATASPSGS